MAIEKWNEKPVGREKIGLEVAKVGAGAGGVMILAGALPFITFPMIVIALIVLGFGAMLF